MTLDHDYLVCLRRLREDEGGGYTAVVPQLGSGTFCATGETVEEALMGLHEIYIYLQAEWEADGRAGRLFPAPLNEESLCFNWSGN